MSGYVRQHIPDRVADMPPGVELAAALAGIVPRSLSGEDLERLLVVQQRQINALKAAQMATMLELGLRDIGPDDPHAGPALKTAPDEFSADALRAPLAWTRRAADIEFSLAWDVQSRIPAVYAAMCSGALDQRRAAKFSEWTLQLRDEQARIVCDRVLPDAPRLTTGELCERLRRECIAIDPEWAARRYADGVKNRRVVKSVNPDGSANLSGQNLPLDEAATAKATVDRLVKKAKAAGDSRHRDLISADIYLGLLSTYRGLSDAQIITDLLTRATREAPDPDDDHPSTGPDPDDTPKAHPAHPARPSPRPDPHPGPHRAPHPRPHPRPAPRPAPAPHPGPAAAPRPIPDPHPGPDQDLTPRPDLRPGRDPDPRLDPDPPLGAEPGSGMGWRSRSEVRAGAEIRAGVEVRIELSTVLGWDDRPAHVPGWDNVHAALARRMVRAQVRGEWRFAVTDAEGRLDTEGITRARPAGWRAQAPRCPGGVVELAIPRTLLMALAADPARTGPWADVITDIATQIPDPDHGRDPQDTLDPEHTPDLHHSPDAHHAPGLRRRGTRVANPRDGGLGGDGEEMRRDVRGRDAQRFPRIGLRRRTQIRDRRCCAPGCRAPAVDCDADHIEQHAEGGATTAQNLQNLCAHDHAMKDRGGWWAERLEDGTTKWTTRHKTTHIVRPPKIITDLPPPRPSPAPHARKPRSQE